jgi:hypothetical protein
MIVRTDNGGDGFPDTIRDGCQEVVRVAVHADKCSAAPVEVKPCSIQLLQRSGGLMSGVRLTRRLLAESGARSRAQPGLAASADP